MSAPFKKSLSQKEHGFTLIELIIVVVIIAVLALIALPKYYASVDKARKIQAYANLDAIRQAFLAYYAAYGVYTNTFPITVVIDGDTIVNLSSPSTTKMVYYICLTGCGPWSSSGDPVGIACIIPGRAYSYLTNFISNAQWNGGGGC